MVWVSIELVSQPVSSASSSSDSDSGVYPSLERFTNSGELNSGDEGLLVDEDSLRSLFIHNRD